MKKPRFIKTKIEFNNLKNGMAHIILIGTDEDTKQKICESIEKTVTRYRGQIKKYESDKKIIIDISGLDLRIVRRIELDLGMYRY